MRACASPGRGSPTSLALAQPGAPARLLRAPRPSPLSPPRSPHVRPDQARRPRLFGRPRHQRDPQVAAGDLQLRGRHLHRRPRPGRGARAGARQGQADGRARQAHLHRRLARGVRARLRVPDDARQRALRGRLPARHLDRPAADLQAAGRDRPRDRRRRGRPRRHRQGQRPGPLRALAPTRSTRTSRSSPRGASGT